MKCSGVINKCRDCKEWNKEKKEVCPKCGADMKCQADAVTGWKWCKQHGGPNPKNNFYGKMAMTNGKGSQFPIMRLAAKYAEMQKNGLVMSNRAAVDVLDHRIKQLLERIDVNEAPERINKLYGLWTELKKYEIEGKNVEVIVTKKEIDAEFEKAYHDYMAWKQVFEALDIRGKMMERELKLVQAMKGLMTAEDGYELVAKVMGAMMRVVGDDPQKLRQMQYEFAKLTGESSDLVIEEFDSEHRQNSEPVGGQEGFSSMDEKEILHSRDKE